MKKRFSQVFLVNKKVAREMIEKMNLKKGEYVLEIGPGKGILTKILLEKKVKVIAIEIDRNLCRYLRENILDLDFSLIEGDFLKINIKEILDKFNLKKVKLLSNVPYNITTPLLIKLIRERENFSEIYLTLQKEVVERINAKPGTKEFSSLTIFINFYMDIKVLMPIPAHFFYPKPKVNSLFFRMIPKEKLQIEKEKEEIFFKLVRRAFQERRKKIGKILKELGLYEKVPEEIREKRPDQISIEEYIKIIL
ncbi:MAG: 16S rRNA (adenine(1518)-N(6)/adenine(1519)-N(6))-dimethyltransferase RsmA [candidate division WOR-3 bacterium]